MPSKAGSNRPSLTQHPPTLQSHFVFIIIVLLLFVTIIVVVSDINSIRSRMAVIIRVIRSDHYSSNACA